MSSIPGQPQFTRQSCNCSLCAFATSYYDCFGGQAFTLWAVPGYIERWELPGGLYSSSGNPVSILSWRTRSCTQRKWKIPRAATETQRSHINKNYFKKEGVVDRVCRISYQLCSCFSVLIFLFLLHLASEPGICSSGRVASPAPFSLVHQQWDSSSVG